ncbi:hypothetical protein ACROYT_G017035 [Oculina patagonica]
MNLLISLGILTILCFDVEQVKGGEVSACPPCQFPVQCGLSPCDFFSPCTEDKICEACCGSCGDYTCTPRHD